MRICWAQVAFLLVVIVLGTLSLLTAGCGQKGPLYLPEETVPPAEAQAPEPEPASTDAEDTTTSAAGQPQDTATTP